MSAIGSLFEKKNFTAEHAEIAEIIYFFLGVLCELCGELLCFLFDQTGSFLVGSRADT